MPPFRPGIGEQEIKCFHGSARQQITHRIGTFDPQQPHVADPGSFARSCANSTEQPFDPEKIFLRRSPRQCAKKRAVAAAKIDMGRSIAFEDFRRIESLDQRL